MVYLLHKDFGDFPLPLLGMIHPEVFMINFIIRLLTLLSPVLLCRVSSLGPLTFHTTKGALRVSQHFLVIDVSEFEELYQTVCHSKKVVQS